MTYLRLIREPTVDGVTFGSLYLDGAWFLWTLEDAIREVAGQPVDAWKIRGQTAIPAGLYRVELTISARFKRVLPLVVGVPGFDGVRLHRGNVVEDTDGCPLVGTGRAGRMVTGSRVAEEKLMQALTGRTDIWVRIDNPITQEE